MPWKETRPMDERVKFMATYLKGELSFSRLCAEYGISRRVGYKWLARYSTDGVAGLADASRRPKSNPNAVPPRIVELIVACRRQHRTWGPKKLLVHLRASYVGLELPSASTVSNILKRNGLAFPRRRRASKAAPYGQPFLGYDRPNAVWCADFKGHFRLGNRKRCHPLTITDGFSRYLIRCKGLSNQLETSTREVFESAFLEFGLPDAIRTDNGSPFSARTPGGLSRLAVWWIKLGIRPERIRPGHPEENGRHERMHRTLKADAVNPAKRDMKAQQLAFDSFQKEYNNIRPHEALNMQTPGKLYRPSARAIIRNPPDPTYSDEYLAKRANQDGELRFASADWYISWNLRHELLGVMKLSETTWLVQFGGLPLGTLDLKTLKRRKGVSKRPVARMQELTPAVLAVLQASSSLRVAVPPLPEVTHAAR